MLYTNLDLELFKPDGNGSLVSLGLTEACHNFIKPNAVENAEGEKSADDKSTYDPAKHDPAFPRALAEFEFTEAKGYKYTFFKMPKNNKEMEPKTREPILPKGEVIICATNTPKGQPEAPYQYLRVPRNCLKVFVNDLILEIKPYG